MADLQELCNVLQALADTGGSAKVSYYYVDTDGIGLRNGTILVDHGVRAHLDHAPRDAAGIIADIASLKLVKVASLPLKDIPPAPDLASIDLSQFVAGLREHLKRNATQAPGAVAPRQTATQAASAAAAPAASMVSPFPASPGSTAQFVAILSAPGIELRAEAQKLLEPLLGAGTTRKLDDFARVHPPSERPLEFLRHCQQHVSVVLGASQAETLFRPLYERFGAGRARDG